MAEDQGSRIKAQNEVCGRLQEGASSKKGAQVLSIGQQVRCHSELQFVRVDPTGPMI
jgi:hypothetical protein